MPITDSISQLIDGVRIVFGRLCLCHSVIALGGQFTWNWSNVAVNHILLNAARAVWSPVFFTHHRPHHVPGVRGPENGSLFFRWIAYVIYSGSCLIPKAVAFGDRYKLWKTNEHTILKLWTLIKNIIKSTHKFPYDILFTFLMDRGRAPNGIGHLMILSEVHRWFTAMATVLVAPLANERYYVEL